MAQRRTGKWRLVQQKVGSHAARSDSSLLQDLIYAMRNIAPMVKYADKGYKLMSVWLLSSTSK